MTWLTGWKDSKIRFPLMGSPEPTWDNTDGELLNKFYTSIGSGGANQEKRPYISDVREELVRRLILVLDGFDRIFSFAENQVNEEDSVLRNWLSSMKGTQKNLLKILQREGLTRMETIGQKLDFNLHEVVGTREKMDCEPGIVLEEVEPGYLFRDRILRAAKVIVSQSGN